MDSLPALGRNIQDIAGPTFKAYEPLLLANARKIRSVPKVTFPYGQHERQKLDMYYATNTPRDGRRHTVLLFAYGGGLVVGDRTLQVADGLVHANLAAFFVQHYGYSVAVMDYRRVPEGAKFPSGGEDVAKVVEFLVQEQRDIFNVPVDLFVMGNSAGGIHLSTFLLHDDFAATRRRVLNNGSGVALRGTIFLSVPFHFDRAEERRYDVLRAYFGDWKKNCPFSLLEAAQASGRSIDILEAGVRVMVLNGELDPEDEILQTRDDFLRAWLAFGRQGINALAVDMMKGHNHLSPVPALSTGIAKEEAWGHQVAAFCEGIRKTMKV